MADPQKPQYDKPWCPKCKAHSEYVEKQENEWAGGEGTRSVTVYDCVDCNKRMYVPRKYNLSNEGIHVRFLCVYYLVASIGIGLFWFGFDLKHSDQESWLMFLMGMFALAILTVPAGVTIWFAVKYAAWVKWAKERGWEEEKPKAE